MANHANLSELFTDIADKIRAKTGGGAALIADNFPDEINSIVTLSEGSADATATAADIDRGKTAYVAGSKVTGTSTKIATSDATAAASDIASGKTAYVNGSKVTGTAVIPTYTAEWGNAIAATIYTTNPKKTNFYFFGTTLAMSNDYRLSACMYGISTKKVSGGGGISVSTSTISATRSADRISVTMAEKKYSSDTWHNTGYCLIDY